MDNAQWDPSTQSILYGFNYIYSPMPSLDIISHEFGHGICQAEYPPNGLTYVKESGAINESLSDIWGACVLKYANDHFTGLNKQVWQVASDIETRQGHNGFRSLVFSGGSSGNIFQFKDIDNIIHGSKIGSISVFNSIKT